MENLTLQQLFGANAVQDSQTLTVRKSDLPGLTQSANNHAESLLVGILLIAWRQFEAEIADEQGRFIADEQGRILSFDHHNLYEKIDLSFWKRQFVRGKVRDTFVINLLVKPPTVYSTALKTSDVIY